ncbi:MAG: cupin domain-containing protein [Methylobacteriaceae bacterium]|jgi:mannose-6-phosphate isomerase-like protein (cupin superfamily)|nr:cupin domain-containing protein [Methylobacteriaceae bacterium]
MDALTAESLTNLVDAVTGRYAAKGGESERIRREIALVLGHVREARQRPPSVRRFERHGVTDYVDQAVAAARKTAPELAATLEPVAAELYWRYGYSPRPDAPGLENAMAWTELVGPGHYWHSDDVCLGLTLIAPHNLYPDHYHPAVELYTVVAGESDWTLEGVTTRRFPGDRILHEKNAVHAMRSFDEPLLAIYSWTGDVLSPSRYAGL